ncbi:MAG: putative acetyltransferase [Halioglobus sp.]|jgi:putative acetyltransferase
MLIRAEQPEDEAFVYTINTTAFEQPAEAELVDALRKQVEPIVSLVAEDEDAVVGHILFSPVAHLRKPKLKIMGLAPMAVLPEYQSSGIGSQLVRAGLEQCRQLGYVAAVVLGHPHYYPRFGFEPASTFRIDSEYDVPDTYFMAMELQPGALKGRGGKVLYHPLFKSV